jgi:triosephosphate isomerase (TIM)
MRTPIIAGNWKMFKTVGESVDFVKSLIPAINDINGIEKVVAPTFIALYAVSEALHGTNIKVSSQQVHFKDEGAFTSQVSPTQLKGLVEYAIIGHSECRQYLNETDTVVNQKTLAALQHGIMPIVAVGESLEIRQAGNADSFVKAQLIAALQSVKPEDISKVVIAYEPIWAIGTGMSATPDDAGDMIGKTVRGTLRELYGDLAEQVRIQYGGSVNPDNMKTYMSIPDIDGALVGGASLKVDSFTKLIQLGVEAKGL